MDCKEGFDLTPTKLPKHAYPSKWIGEGQLKFYVSVDPRAGKIPISKIATASSSIC